jgi:hypothetical protein
MIMGGSISVVGEDCGTAIFARQDGTSRSGADHEAGIWFLDNREFI